MNELLRTACIEEIKIREKVRHLSRLYRLIRYPFRTVPYYILAVAARVRPLLVNFDVLWGDKMSGYLPECNTFYYYGYGEANLTNFFLRNIKPGWVCLDIGAHIGSYTTLLARLVEPEGIVCGFEPTPWTFKLLQKNTSTYKNIQIENMAVTHSHKTITFSDYGPGYGAYNTGNKNGTSLKFQADASITVSGSDLDSYCQLEGIEPDLIKIDVEGLEYEVLFGSKNLLRKDKAKRPILIIEVANGEQWAENRQSSFKLLTDLGYKPYEITIDGTVIPHLLRQDYVYENLVFITDENLSTINIAHDNR